jgi:hypothetical protein
MRLVVNHLTRMHHGHVCVAGVDLDTHRHVRPVLLRDALTPGVLARNGGPFDMANVVQFTGRKRCPTKPHVEDRLFTPSRAKLVDTVDAERFWALLVTLSKRKLRDIFGNDLRRTGRSSAGTDAGKGEASLGCLLPMRRPDLCVRIKGERGPRIRMHVRDGQLDVWVAVTDLRLYQNDHTTPDQATVEKIRRRLAGPAAVILSVGLTRPFASSAEAKPLHWLQVNNIHLEDDPTWQLG